MKRLVALALLAWITNCAQSPQVRPEFEVASIKPNHSGVPLTGRTEPVEFTPGGRFTATNVTLVDMIVRSYPTRRIQMEGALRAKIDETVLLVVITEQGEKRYHP
jgi:hypothetical protein